MSSSTLSRYSRRRSPEHSPDSAQSAATPSAMSSRTHPSSENLSRQQPPSEPPSDTELLDLWDNTWFGVSTSPPSAAGSIGHRHSSKFFTADPLAFVVPTLSASQQQQQLMLLRSRLQQGLAAGAQHMSEHDMSFAAWQQQQQQAAAAVSNRNSTLQQHPAVSGSSAAQQQQQEAQQQQQQQQQQQLDGGSPAAPQTIPSTDEQPLPPQQQQQQQQELAAPFVLGTWAQRQYRMPDHQQQQAADSAQQPVPLTGRWAAAAASSSTAAAANGNGNSVVAAAAAQQVAAEVAAADAAAAAAQQAGASAGGGAVRHGGNAAALAAAAAAAAAGAAGLGGGCGGQPLVSRRSIGTDEEEELVTQAAWRWRFAKRWQAEQTRAPDAAAPGASVGDGGMEDALQWLAACGENWHLARAASAEPGTTLDSRGGGLGTLGTPSLLTADLLVGGDGSYSGHRGSGGLLQSNGSGGLMGGYLSREVSGTGAGGAGGGAGRGEATQQVTGMTKRAAQLLAQQSDINKAVTQRWREVQSVQGCELWVGAVLESVEVDDWGKFKWLLLRLRDRSGRQKLLVRGANYASDAKIVEGLHRQMMAACTAHNVCAEAIEVVGGGVMEWRRHRDRHLHISGGYVAPASGPGGPSTPAEVMNLAAVLTKQHLPMHYKVTSDGGKAL